jgi:type II secretory pathway component PulM
LRFNNWFETLLSTFPLSTWVAGGVAALLVWVGVLAYRHAGRIGPRARRQRDVAAVGAVLLLAIIGSVYWLHGSTNRQSLETRLAELRER